MAVEPEAATFTVTSKSAVGTGRVSSRVAVTRTVCAPSSSPTEVRAVPEESVKARVMPESSSSICRVAPATGRGEPPNVISSPWSRMVSPPPPSATLSSFTNTSMETCLKVIPAGISNPRS